MSRTPSPLCCPTLVRGKRIAHGFFTRQGGVSTGIYESLNCGPGSDDQPSVVVENRRRAVEALSHRPFPLVTARQIHSATALVVQKPWQSADPPAGDALVTNRPGLVLGVLTADCGPVLMVDEQAGVIAAAHAGWKGALGGILEAALDVMLGLGAARQRIHAAIGPTIAQASYEVGDDFRDRFVAQDSQTEAFFCAAPRPGHCLFDLPGYIAQRLRNAEIAQVDDLRVDTRDDERRFFSFRRTTLMGDGDYGRQLSAICLLD